MTILYNNWVQKNGCSAFVQHVNDNVNGKWIGIRKLAGGTACSTKIMCADNEDILFNFHQFM